ncbi:DUF7836 family putative zinc-binding protein [Natronorubrum halophilum]|uniref:DUF7836 family putative zinc-binding protein n=1 Tax=Natronorubrum halophilum TaxID=1702106 RepID=UPI000EF6748A|nr:hypothetical protein [Natronorubrum halophilum]
MDETTVKLLCPECTKNWQHSPNDLPAAANMFHCPNCHASRRLSEFMQTDRDLRTLKQLG